MLEGVRRVLLCMLEVMRCVLFCLLEVLEVPEVLGGDASCAALYAGGAGVA